MNMTKEEDKILDALVKLALCPGSGCKDDNCKYCEFNGKVGCQIHLKNKYKSQLVEARTKATPITSVVEVNYSDNLEQKVTKLMHSCGIPAHIKGYHYIRQAIIMAVNDMRVLDAVTKELYPNLAKMFDTTSSRVERAIRHAIEVAWDRGDEEVLYEYFGYTIQGLRGKPTNSEFISMIADKIRIDLK